MHRMVAGVGGHILWLQPTWGWYQGHRGLSMSSFHHQVWAFLPPPILPPSLLCLRASPPSIFSPDCFPHLNLFEKGNQT